MIVIIYLRSVFNCSDDTRTVYIPRVRIHDYRMVAPTAGKTSPNTTDRSGDERQRIVDLPLGADKMLLSDRNPQ